MSDRVALVTGGSRGLGAVLVGFLHASDWAVITDARDATALEAARGSWGTGGVPVRAIPGDVADEAHQGGLVAAARDAGGLDLLVHNASRLGPSPLRPLTELDGATWRDILETNVQAPVALTRGALPLLVSRGGLVVHVTSDAAQGGYEGWGGYGASKAALELISLTLAHELKARGVASVAVDPGDMRTQMHQEAFVGQDISDRPLPEVTLPFWAWLLGQDPTRLTGGRFRAQAEVWEVPA